MKKVENKNLEKMRPTHNLQENVSKTVEKSDTLLSVTLSVTQCVTFFSQITKSRKISVTSVTSVTQSIYYIYLSIRKLLESDTLVTHSVTLCIFSNFFYFFVTTLQFSDTCDT